LIRWADSKYQAFAFAFDLTLNLKRKTLNKDLQSLKLGIGLETNNE